MNRSGTGAQALRIEKKRLAVGQNAAASVKKARFGEKNFNFHLLNLPTLTLNTLFPYLISFL